MRGLYAIVDADFLERRDVSLIAFAERVISAKPAVVQLRAKRAEARDILAADNEAAPTVLRARRGERDALIARLTAAGVVCEPGRFGPDQMRAGPDQNSECNNDLCRLE